MTLKKKLLSIAVGMALLPATNGIHAADVSSVTDILSTAEEVSDLVTTTVDVGDSTDVISSVTSGDESTIFGEASSYVSGATTGLTELIASLSDDAVTALSATASSVGLDSSASSLLSGSGYSSGQDSELSILSDILTSNEVDNLETDCVSYKYIGQCWSMKSSYPWSFASKSIAQNYISDLQVEVTSRIPNEDVSFFDSADNAPTDIFSGGIIQNVGAIFGRIMDSLFSIGPDLQWIENQSAKTESADSLLFREAMVIGNPTSSLVVSVWSALPGYCSSKVTSYMPYYVSSMDIFSWRIMATTDALILAIYSADYVSWNEIGASMGSVYPRMGLNESPEEFDVGVTTAYRAISIVSDLRTSYSGVLGLHIGVPTDAYASGSRQNRSDMKFRTVRDHETQLLRMTYPKEEDTCTNYSSISKVEKEAQNKIYTDDNKYQSSAFKVYRPYVCCKKKYSYLFSTKFFDPDFERY